MTDDLTRRLLAEINRLPIVDTHSHIDPRQPAGRSLDDLVGYHYYTELAHSVGAPLDRLQPGTDPRERCRAVFAQIDRFANTAQAGWLLDIAREFLGFTGDRLSAGDADALYDAAQRVMSQPSWGQTVIERTQLERVFLTNAFDDPLDGFDRKLFVPCLRVDDLVFQFHEPEVLSRVRQTSATEFGDWQSFRKAVMALVSRFAVAGAAACAISLPPDFRIEASTLTLPLADRLSQRVFDLALEGGRSVVRDATSQRVIGVLAEACREFHLPFDLMVGVNRGVYPGGVYQGQDLFDSRASLMQLADLFNAFPEVTFPVSVLSSGLNQELVSFAWIFPNVLPHGHWWYSNVPAYIEPDLRARLTAVPQSKVLGYYSDAYKLEFVLPKFAMYRRALARVLADDFVRPGRLTEDDALRLAVTVLRDNPKRVFNIGERGQ